jgi:hypothetical protein
LITSADLKTQTKNDLAQMAKRLGVTGWNALSKDQLVAAIVKRKKAPAAKASSKTASKKSAGKPASAKAAAPKNAPGRKTTKKAVGPASRVAAKATAKSAPAKTPAAKLKKDAAASKILAAGKSPRAEGARAQGKGEAKLELRGKKAAEKATNGAALKGSAASKTVSASQTAAKKPSVRPARPSQPPTSPAVLQRIRQLQVQRESTKDLSSAIGEAKKSDAVEEQQQKDRIVLVVRDAYWLQVTWDVTRRAVERARAAMAEYWHHAQPVLRLLRLDDSGTTSAAETIERDIVIHGGVRNWYIDLNGTPGRFRVMIGYLSGNRFHMLAKSNIVRTPTPGTTDAVDDHWSDIARDAERVFALSGGYDNEQETTELQEVFEDRLKRSMGGPQLAQYGSGAEAAFRGRGGFHFDLEVELFVYGSTVPDGFVTLNGEPVKLRSDGTFSLRLPFPDRRQVLPAVACSRDGVQQRTVVVAVERNTKVMEPFSKEQDDQG